MTEAEWLKAIEPVALLREVAPALSNRHRRMIALAACRMIPEEVLCPGHRAILSFAGRVAERPSVKLNSSTLRTRLSECWIPRTYDSELGKTAHAAVAHLLADDLEALLMCVTKFHSPNYARMSRVCEPLAALIRDIFGNPFRPAALAPSWLTPTVLALARQMYAPQDFSPMPILADALQDAGCENADILSHCRGPNQVHVRGCWVVDLLLGRE
jgi:hypothetical protein